MKRRRLESGIGPLDLLEQAVHLLRTAPVTALLAYYTGTAPFVLVLLFFWSDMSRSAFAESRLAGGALLLSLLFVWMKAWQSAAASILHAQVAQQPTTPWNLRRAFRVAARQLSTQPAGLFLLPIGSAILLPFGWLFAFFQNACVLAAVEQEGGDSFLRRVWRATQHDAMQNHSIIGLMFLFGMFVWLNLAIVLLSAPFLFRTLTGIETPFTLSMQSMLNTTFFAVVCALTYLCLDPVFKAAYVLRCFYDQSRGTGEDLRVRLRTAAIPGLLALVVFLAPSLPATAAEENITEPKIESTTTATRLDASINEVLTRREYAWRAPREAERDEESTFWKRVDEWLRDTMRAMKNWWERIFAPRRLGPGTSLFSGKHLTYGLIALVATIIGVLLYLLWRAADRAKSMQLEAAPVSAVPDLEDESVSAGQLPEDGWLRLALELMDRGELRLALRALYLASLAHLAGRNLVTLARFKSNRDYERELLKRSHALPEVSDAFSDNVSVFDRVWYGMHEINDDMLHRFRLNVERIQSS